jgi:sugar O-acyltransferase (sialic acid O-acetyltransferase NeuD family)
MNPQAPGRVLVFGAGGLGREVLQLLHDIAASGQSAECVAFAVDPGVAAPGAVCGVPVRRDAAAMLRADTTLQAVVALGNPAAREAVVARLAAEAGARFATLLHPSAWLGQTVEIGEGSMVFGFSSATADVHIGRHVLINPGSNIAHDCVLSDFATLAPAVALAGGVRVEHGAELGIGARVAPRLSIGRGSMVGAGAVVISDVAAGTTVAGVPARKL